MPMKRYSIRVPRDYHFSTVVDAENSREARFEAIKSLVFRVLHDFIPFEVNEGETVYPCDRCNAFFPKDDLTEAGERLLCAQCQALEQGDVPETW